MKQYLYGKKSATVTSAAGAKGVLFFLESGNPVFRSDQKGGEIHEYAVLHSDLEITFDSSNITCLLCASAFCRPFLRIKKDDGSYDDIELPATDQNVTIASDELASFYQVNEHYYLDETPETLGLTELSQQ